MHRRSSARLRSRRTPGKHAFELHADCCCSLVLLPLQSMFSSESEKTVDPAFESARTDFYRLNDWVHKIKRALTESDNTHSSSRKAGPIL